MCRFKDCKLKSCYNFENKKIAMFCNLHKKEGMIFFNGYVCFEKDCNMLLEEGL